MNYRKLAMNVSIPVLLIASLSNGRAQAKPPQPDLGPDLFMAIGENDLSKTQALLKQGADPNAKNFLTFTPLHWVALRGHEAIAKTLLANGAVLEAETPFGTPLTFALESNHPEVARLFLARKANIAAKRGDGITTLMLAASNGDPAILQQILAQKAPVNAQDKNGETALICAARNGQTNAARLLLNAGANVNLADSQKWTPLTFAIANRQPALVRLLIAKGADVNGKDTAGKTPLIIAALYSRQPEVIRELLAHKADANAKDAQGKTAKMIAEEHRDAECLFALSGTRMIPATLETQPLLAPQKAITQSLSLLEKTNVAFANKAGCVSCHHEGLGLMATAAAQQRGFSIDTALAKETQKRIYEEHTQSSEVVKQALTNPEIFKHIPGIEISEVTPMLSYTLSGLAAHGWPADEKLADLAQVLARQQAKDGHWQFLMPRVPVQSSLFTMTALSLRALQAYMPASQAAETNERVARAREWLLRTPAQSTEDKTFRLLGLLWAKASLEQRQMAIAELRGLQRADGGWAQQAGMYSDAYATGQALYALHVAGEVAVRDAGWQRGQNFLYRTRDEDGSWYVNKRAIPANNFLDVGFPHGESQYISYAATCWAVMALTQAETPTASTARLGSR